MKTRRFIFYLCFFVSFFVVFSGTIWAEAVSKNDKDEEDYWVRVRPIGKVSDIPSETYRLIESRLENVKNGGLNPADFFRFMGSDGLTMSDMTAFKAEFLRRKTNELARARGEKPLKVLPDALRSWSEVFGPAERKLMETRRKGVKVAFDNAVKSYLKKKPDFPYIVKMDVGGWASESYRDLRFEGDIDFSVITAQVEDAVLMRNLYDSEVKRAFGMDMANLEAHATAQRRPTTDVYITQAGADWAEIDALKRGVLQEVTIVDGKVQYVPVTDPMTKTFIFANLKNNLQMRKGAGDQLARLMDESPNRRTVDMEPAISLEMLRHMTTDAVRADLAFHEKLIKLAKFVDRSTGVSHVPSCDPALVAWAGKVTSIKQNKALSPSQRLKKILDVSSSFLGSPADTAGLNRAIVALGERSGALIRENVSRGIDARMKVIADADSPGKKDSERSKLLNDLEEIYKAYVEKGVDYPPKANEAMLKLAESLKRTTIRIPSSELKKMRELLQKSAEKPGSFEFALAIVWEKTASYYDSANKAVDGFNNVIDYMDNVTVARLRSLNTELRLGSDAGRFKLTVPIPIGIINDRLNSSFMGKIGDSLPLKSINLGQEAFGYWDAIARGKNWPESFSNLATQVFRSRVPGGDIVESFVMENYTRLSIGVVYLLFPTTAVPEALYGLSVAAAQWSVDRWERWQYDEMVNALYEGTEFNEDTGMVQTITFKPLRGKPQTVSREEAFTLPSKFPQISNILLPQIKKHPSIAMYHELLENRSISDGRSSIPLWPRRYKNLSLYGEKLWQRYAREVDVVTRQYFTDVIAELEKRHEFLSGAGLEKIREIESELGCKRPLLRMTGDPEADRIAMESFISDWEEWSKIHASLMDIREEWSAFFLGKGKPFCSPSSIKKAMIKERSDLAAAKKAISSATVAVEEIIGADGVSKKVIQPAIWARIGAVIYRSGTQERRGMIGKYRKYLESLRQRRTTATIRIVGPDRVQAGIPVNFTALLDRKVRSVRYDWGFVSGGQGEILKGENSQKISWVPAESGRKILQIYAIMDGSDSKWIRGVHPVLVLTRDEAPKAEVLLTSPLASIYAGETVKITAETVSFALDGKNFSRYFWFINGRQVGSSVENIFPFDGRGYEGRKVTIKVMARLGTVISAESSIDIEVAGAVPSDNSLRVFIMPDISEITAGKSIPLKGTVLIKPGGGKLEYQWAVDGRVVGNGESLVFDSKKYKAGDVKVTLYVRQVTNEGVVLYEGQAVRKILILGDLKSPLSIASCPSKVKDTEDVKICVVNPDKNISYEWFEWTGKRWSDNTVGVGRCMTKSARGLSGHKLRFKVVASNGRGQSSSAETELIEVIEAQPQQGPEEELSDEEEKEKEKEKEKVKVKVNVPQKDYPESIKDEESKPSKKVVIEAPARVLMGDIFDAKALIPSDLVSKVVTYGWRPGVADHFDKFMNERPKMSTPEAKLQFSFYSGQKETKKREVGVKLLDSKKEKIDYGSIMIAVDPLRLAVTAPSIWEGSATADGFTLKRKEQTKVNPKGNGAAVHGSFSAKIKKNRLRPDKLKEAVTSMGYSSSRVQSVSIGNYKGYMTIKKIRVRAMASSYRDWAQLSASCSLSGIVAQGGVAIEFSGRVGGGGDVFGVGAERNSPAINDAFFLKAQMKQGQQELISIVGSIRPGPDFSLTSTPYAAPVVKADEKMEVELVRVPASGPVAVGQSLKLTASVKGEKPDGGLIYHFQPHPEVRFTHQESSSDSTDAVFYEPGKTAVWVSVIDKDGKTLAESEQMEIDVTGPVISLSVKPIKPEIGQEVSVKATVDPALPEGSFIVWNLTGKSSRQGARAADSTEFSFLAEEKSEYTLDAEARSSGGKTLSRGNVKVQVDDYDLKVTVLGSSGPRPREWREKEGLREIPENTFLVDEHVRVKAEVMGSPVPDNLRWSWTAGEGTSMVSGGTGKEVTIYGSQPGSASVRVEVRNRDGLILGSGRASFPVVELPAELKAKFLSVTIEQSLKVLSVNEKVVLKASVTGGTPPYSYKWDGGISGAKQVADFVADQPGKKTINVNITDKEGVKASTSIVITILPLKVTIESLPSVLKLGETFSSVVRYPISPAGSTVNRKPVPQVFMRSNNCVKLRQASGNGRGFSGRAVSTGRAEIWAEVKNRRGILLGTSEKVVFSVEAPVLSLKVPKSVAVGKRFRAQVSVPEGSLPKDVFSLIWGGSTSSVPREDGTAAYGPIYGLDPVTASVEVKLASGLVVTNLTGKINVTPLKMNIKTGIVSGVRKIVTPEGKIDYPPKGQWIQGQTAVLKAVPVVETSGVMFRWTVTEGGSLTSNRGRSVSLSMKQKGTIVVTVVAIMGGREAGKAVLEFPVTISQNQVEAAQVFGAVCNEWSAKRYDKALELMKKAVSLDPSNGALKKILTGMESKIPDVKSGSESLKKRRAQEIWREAEKLLSKRKHGEALKKYREGLSLHSDPQIEILVRRLEVVVSKNGKNTAPSVSKAPEVKVHSSESLSTSEKKSQSSDCGVKWKKISKYGMSFSVPRDWVFHEDGWFLGDPENSQAVVGIDRISLKESKQELAFFKDEHVGTRTVKVAGRSLKMNIYKGIDEESGKPWTMVLITLQDPRSSKYVLDIGYSSAHPEKYKCIFDHFIRSFR